MLDFIGTVVGTAVLVLNLNAFISTAQITRRARFGLTIAAGLWVGIATAVSNAGLLA
jgi:hypothetical protein